MNKLYFCLKHLHMKLIVSLGLLVLSAQIWAQTFSDDFESYSAGQYIGVVNSTWTTWSGSVGGTEDVQVVTNNANSGSNSIYFSSTSSTGGPQDVILPFGGELNTGVFNIKASFNVQSGKGAYFNFQGESTIGNVWAIDCQMDETGKMVFRGDGNQLLATSFSHNTWFELELNADLNTNSWEVFIDGNSVGTFQNYMYQIASMDIFPVNASNNQSGFWMDDVEYTVTPFTSPNINAAVSKINFVGALTGQEITPKIEIRNLGTTAITSFDLNLDYNGQQLTKTVSGVNISPNGSMEIDLGGSTILITGTNNMTATVSNVNGNGNDDYANDDVKILAVTPIDPAEGKIVVAEEATGTWCQYCPRGAVYMDRFAQKYGKFFAGIAVHNNDPMEDPVYDQGLGGLISGYPSGVVDRGSDKDPSEFEPDFLDRIVTAPVASLTNGAKFNSTSNQLDISVAIDYLMAGSGAYKIACVITEDSVTGTSSGYAQVNAFSGGATEMGGYENLPNPVPASIMIYDHVARSIAPSFNGTAGTMPSSFVAGDTSNQVFTFTIDNTWDMSKMHIIAMLIAPNGRVETASNSTIQEALGNGYLSDGEDLINGSHLFGPDQFISFYPNPTSGQGFIKFKHNGLNGSKINMYDITGKLLMSKNILNMPKGFYEMPLDLKNHQGMFFIELQTVNKAYREKLIIK